MGYDLRSSGEALAVPALPRQRRLIRGLSTKARHTHRLYSILHRSWGVTL